jgi:hypothetical protein
MIKIYVYVARDLARRVLEAMLWVGVTAGAGVCIFVFAVLVGVRATTDGGSWTDGIVSPEEYSSLLSTSTVSWTQTYHYETFKHRCRLPYRHIHLGSSSEVFRASLILWG